MKVKTDTKEKFHVITVAETSLTADMAAEITDLLLPYLQNDLKNIILNLKELQVMDEPAAEKIVKLQQNFYENSASFVICGLQKSVEDFLDKIGLLEILNITPTESEAWDIVQMEEIEREMLDSPLSPPNGGGT
jgi:anti-anti-sigma factor